MLSKLGPFIAIAILLGGVMWLSLAYWALKDARSRSESAAFHIVAMVINLAFPLVGLVVYMLIRPSMTLIEERALELEAEALAGAPQETEDSRPCPACGREIEKDFVLCPYCHTRFAKRCPSCRKSVRLGWTLCPYCAASLELGTVTRAAGQG
ncbi:MAG: zinc ribbon domain-containing protein [Candidatus Dormibacteria bacterium]